MSDGKYRSLPKLPLAPYRGGRFGEPDQERELPKLPLAPSRGFSFKDGGYVHTPKSKKYSVGKK